MIPPRLQDALDRFGSDLNRWPPGLAAEAREELARSPAFQAAMVSEAEFDAALRAADPAERTDPAVLARLEAAIMASLPPDPPVRQPVRSYVWWRRLLPELHVPAFAWQQSLAAILVLAAMLGIAAGRALPIPMASHTHFTAGEALASKPFYRGDLQ